MLHEMKLQDVPFDRIASGEKTVELRLFDEKRQRIQVGDFIQFSRQAAPEEQIQVRVTALHRFDGFAALYAAIPPARLGYLPGETADPADMDAYYPKDAQAQHGVLAIELRKTALQRFVDAHANGYSFGEPYAAAVSEIRAGRKRTHWMWYIFPQIRGLGYMDISVYFSIRDMQEARDYYAHPILGAHLREITQAVLETESSDPMIIFGDPDAYKLRSSMTLFKHAVPDDPLFQSVLDRCCMGEEDPRTLARI